MPGVGVPSVDDFVKVAVDFSIKDCRIWQLGRGLSYQTRRKVDKHSQSGGSPVHLPELSPPRVRAIHVHYDHVLETLPQPSSLRLGALLRPAMRSSGGFSIRPARGTGAPIGDLS